MAKNRRKRKLRRGRVPSTRKNISSKLDLQNDLGEHLINAIEEDFEIMDTSFGPIKISDGGVVYSLKNKGAFLAIATMGDQLADDDYLGTLVKYEQLNEEFPEEPFIHVQIADCYKELKPQDKYEQRLAENFKNFKGYPLVDIQYLLNIDDFDAELYDSIFGKEQNIHDVYPHFKAFDEYTVSTFYALKSRNYLNLKEYQQAKECVEIVKMISPTEGAILSSMIASESDPAFRRKIKFLRILFIPLLLLIIGGIIWGIVKLFQWIF